MRDQMQIVKNINLQSKHINKLTELKICDFSLFLVDHEDYAEELEDNNAELSKNNCE
jgi:hypothetical protein